MLILAEHKAPLVWSHDKHHLAISKNDLGEASQQELPSKQRNPAPPPTPKDSLPPKKGPIGAPVLCLYPQTLCSITVAVLDHAV